jgi:hypothetical protein
MNKTSIIERISRVGLHRFLFFQVIGRPWNFAIDRVIDTLIWAGYVTDWLGI